MKAGSVEARTGNYNQALPDPIAAPPPEPEISHLETFFLFPFSLDRDLILDRHGSLWNGRRWIGGLDDWIRAHDASAPPLLGRWQRSAYTSFGLDSPAYQDMVFFHPVVRRIYFDAVGMNAGEWQGEEIGGEGESLLRFYRMPIAPEKKVTLRALDDRGRSDEVHLKDLRMILFANGIGILSMGVEARAIPARRALWINEMMRKLYPSSTRQMREGRTPSLLQICVDGAVALTDDFAGAGMRNYLPPISKTIAGLLYFAHYDNQEYEGVLDERMIVYTYMSIDPDSVPANYSQSPEYEVFVARALYVDQWGKDFRYDPEFTRELLKNHLYRRWAHQGTYYGFTSYSNITICFGQFDCDDHLLSEGFLIHRMFRSRYYLMAVIALFYRATLVDFAELAALVSRRLYQDFENNKLTEANIELTDELRYEFVTFSNYWHFDELANKDEEVEHFDMQCDAYRIWSMKEEIGDEVERLNIVLNEYYQKRNTQAVNRLAMLSMILGGGAVLTGFFGMNFGGAFERTFFNPNQGTVTIHWAAILGVAILTFGALLFGVCLIAIHWGDYKDTLVPRLRTPVKTRVSVKKVD